jgi:hypothetical protein
LIFGHGNDDYYYYLENDIDYRGVEVFFEEMHDKLKKDTTKVLENHKAFFETLNPSINIIFSYGFSFSKVDQVYLKEIFKQLVTERVTWYLKDFDNITTRLTYESIITECGFKGSFDTYNIKK